MLLRQSLSLSSGASPAAIPKDLLMNNPRRQGRPPPHSTQVLGGSRNHWQEEADPALANTHHSAIEPSTPRPRSPALRVGPTPPLVGGRDQHWAGPSRQYSMSVWMGEMRREDSPPFTIGSSGDLL